MKGKSSRNDNYFGNLEYRKGNASDNVRDSNLSKRQIYVTLFKSTFHKLFGTEMKKKASKLFQMKTNIKWRNKHEVVVKKLHEGESV